MPAPETYYDVAMRRLDEQIGRIDALDAKAATALGGAAALLPIFGALIAAFTTNAHAAAIVFYAIAFVIYVAMVVTAVLGSRVGDWDLRPDLGVLGVHATNQNEATVKTWVAQECVTAIDTNAPKLLRKALFVDLALAGLILVALALSAAAMVQLFG